VEVHVGPIAGDHADDQPVCFVKRHVVRVVALLTGPRSVGSAMLLLSCDERPLLIERGFPDPEGKSHGLFVDVLRGYPVYEHWYTEDHRFLA
jgi:hypothetical protein